MGKVAFLFPGQGSQEVGMGKSFIEHDLEARSIFEQANEKLQFDLTSLILNGPKEQLTLTENAQPALVTTSVAALVRLQKLGITADYVAGHSLGEYSALIAASSLTFTDGVHAVRQRGLLMEKAVPNGAGAMAAILGLAKEKLAEITNEVSASGHLVQLANINCPGQIVISGTNEGVNIAGEQAKLSGARRVMPLQVSGPFHSQLMESAAKNFAEVLNKIKINDASIPLISNVTATPIQTAAEIKVALLKQIYSPVLWEDSIQKLLKLGVDTFIEIGNGKVLTGLVKKIDRTAKTYFVNDEKSLQETIAALKGEAT